MSDASIDPTIIAALSGRYVIERELGRGSMGIVFLARDLQHDRLVALKLLRPELSMAIGADRFAREVQLTAQLQHPHIMPLFDSGGAGGWLYYIMPYVEGESLRDRLEREKQLSVDDAIAVTRNIASALGHAHGRGIVHRDIKPENIMLSGGLAIVADFGIAHATRKADGDKLTATGMALGTAAYMSPEQAAGDPGVDGRSDIYSLACVLYEMLAGIPPFVGGSAQAVAARHARDPVPPLDTIRPDLPPPVIAAVTKALAKSPADRFRTTAEFSRSLTLGSGEASAVQPRRHHRHPALIAAPVALALIGLAAWSMTRTSVARAMGRGVAVLPCDAGARTVVDSFPNVDRWTEELIGKLVRVGGVNPKEWSSVKRYETTTLGSRQIAQELNAGLIVRCRVANSPDSVRVTLTLIDPRNESVLWTETYARAPGAHAANDVQAAATLGLAEKLGIVPSTSAAAAVNRPLTRDTMALRQYHLGMHFLNRVGPGDPEKAIRLLDSAIARDPMFAQAYPALSGALELSAETAHMPPPADSQVKLNRRAIALDSGIATAHSELGYYLLNHDHDWPAAEREFKRAVELNPNSVDVHIAYGLGLHLMERYSDAIKEFERALEADPVIVISHAQLARTLLYDGQHDRARSEILQGLALAPDAPPLHHLRAHLHLKRGHSDSALASLGRIGSHHATDAWLYAVAGDRVTAQAYLDSLISLRSKRPVDPTGIAMIHIGLRNDSAAIEWLNRGYEEGSHSLLGALSHPAFAPLRRDPRFGALRRKVGLR